ncbi:MAG: hypothetical protein ACP5VE_11185 [Chthonomonadales bacterium]
MAGMVRSGQHATLVLAVMSLLCAQVQAQGFFPNLRIKAGVFIPSGGTLAKGTGDLWFKIGADAALPLGFTLLGGTTRAGIEYTARGSSSIVPITLTQVLQPSLTLGHSPVYVGGGIGLWTVHVAGAGSGSNLGFRVLGGVEIGRSSFIEVEYDFVGRVHGVNTDGLTISAGLRF